MEGAARGGREFRSVGREREKRCRGGGGEPRNARRLYIHLARDTGSEALTVVKCVMRISEEEACGNCTRIAAERHLERMLRVQHERTCWKVVKDVDPDSQSG